MNESEAERRQVRCRILLESEWIEGTFLVPRIRNFLEHLETMREFVPLVDVRFSGTGHVEPFFDVNRDAIRLVEPPAGEREHAVPTVPASVVEHEVFCLLVGGHLHGKLGIRKGLRTSDFFRAGHRFVTLRDCRFVPRDLSSEEGESPAYPAMSVQAKHVLGVSEPAGPVTGLD